MKLIRFFTEIYDYREVVKQLVWQYISVRYKRTYLGFVWTLINPLLNLIVITVVFSMLLRFDVANYAVYLITGLIPWMFFLSGISQAGDTLIDHESIIKKIYIPRHVFPVSRLIGVFIDSLLSSLALMLIILVLGVWPTFAILFLPVSFVLLFAFVAGVALLQSVLVVYLRDMKHVVPIVLQTWFYVTPVIYPLKMIPEQYQSLFKLNPLVYFLELFRGPLYDGVLPGTNTIVLASVMAASSLVVGVLVFRAYSDDIVFRL